MFSESHRNRDYLAKVSDIVRFFLISCYMQLSSLVRVYHPRNQSFTSSLAEGKDVKKVRPTRRTIIVFILFFLTVSPQ